MILKSVCWFVFVAQVNRPEEAVGWSVTAACYQKWFYTVIYNIYN